MARKPLHLLAKQIKEDEFEQQLRKAALTALDSIQRKVISRKEWIKNRNKQLKDLQNLAERLDEAYQLGDIDSIKVITNKLTSYVEAYNIDELLQSGHVQLTEMSHNGYSSHVNCKFEARVPLELSSILHDLFNK